VIVFASQSPGLTQPPISNGYQDIFVRECVASGPSVYCIAQVASNGCVPAHRSFGKSQRFERVGLRCRRGPHAQQQVRHALLRHARIQPRAVYAGWLCVHPPVRRHGSAVLERQRAARRLLGSLPLDFNAWIAGGNDPSLAAGTEVWCQYWSRDGGAEFQTNLSNALSFTIGP
jgi:hypothetical protein